MQIVNQLWVLLGGGFALSLAVTPLFAWAAEKLGLVDRPAHRKIHTQPVATMGGLPIFLSLGLVLAFYVLFMRSGSTLTRSPFPMKTAVVYGAGLVLALWGAVDDRLHLSSRTKFAGQFVAAFLFSLMGYRFEVFNIPGFQPYPMPDAMAVCLTVFWILAVLNAFNMVDGVDGLATSVCVVSLFFISAAAALFDNWAEMGMALAALGVAAGFLFFNWKPARVYLGDSGSSGLGMLVAGALVALGHGDPLFQAGPVTHPFQPFNYQILIVTLFAAYPALEINLSVFRRLFRGRPIHMADQGHIHHRLMKKGWTPAGIIAVAAAVSLLPGLSALSTLMQLKGWAAWYLALFALALGLGLPLLGFLDFLAPRFLSYHRPHYRIAHHFISMQRIKLSMAATREEVLALVEQTCQELGVQACRLVIPCDGGKLGGLDYIHGFDPTRRDALPEEARGPVDRVRLFGGRGGGKWMFNPQPREEELDMEYRVLTSEFMRDALETAARLGVRRESIEISSLAGLPSQKITSLHLRRSHKEGRDN